MPEAGDVLLASRVMEDSYFFLLEQPGRRQFGLTGERVRYRTKAFDPAFYAGANNLSFADEDAAYRDWLERGRGLGLAYAPGRDTVLKLILKAKDEPDLLPLWIRHHAAIVGFENLIVLDCGSTDPAYRALLAEYADRVLILPYPLYYDHLHTRRANSGFYDLIARNCRYLAVLDADEFLVGREGDAFSGAAVKRLLATSDEAVHAGGWISTRGAVMPGDPVQLNLAVDYVAAGVVAGKSVIRSAALGGIEHIGHNMHDRSVLARLTPGSFGQLVILHLTTLAPVVAQRRYLAHLRARGLLGAHADADAIRAIAERADLTPPVRDYARRWLDAGSIAAPAEGGLVTRLVGGAAPEQLAPLAAALDAVDYAGLIRQPTEALA